MARQKSYLKYLGKMENTRGPQSCMNSLPLNTAVEIEATVQLK